MKMGVPPKGRCRTGKQRFESKVDAMLVVARADRAQALDHRSSREERRVYRCPKCKGWHTTSQATGLT